MPDHRPAVKDTIAIIGLGNWGTSLAQAIGRAGLPLTEVVVRTQRSPNRAGLPVKGWGSARLDATLLWLCVPDRTVAEVAAELAARCGSLRGRIVVHSSGALTVDALEAARRAGARVAAVHPVMTFPSRRPVPLHGVLFGVETASLPVRRLLEDIVRRLGALPFRIQSSRKALYHAAGTMASPLLVSALTAAMETARAAGLRPLEAAEVVGSLADATLRNLRVRGPRESFSGPFARGDAETVKLHLRALAGHPILADVYRSLAGHALDTLPVRNRRELALALNGKSLKQASARPGSARRA